jgi:hypothetical protein
MKFYIVKVYKMGDIVYEEVIDTRPTLRKADSRCGDLNCDKESDEYYYVLADYYDGDETESTRFNEIRAYLH